MKYGGISMRKSELLNESEEKGPCPVYIVPKD